MTEQFNLLTFTFYCLFGRDYQRLWMKIAMENVRALCGLSIVAWSGVLHMWRGWSQKLLNSYEILPLLSSGRKYYAGFVPWGREERPAFFFSHSWGKIINSFLCPSEKLRHFNLSFIFIFYFLLFYQKKIKLVFFSSYSKQYHPWRVWWLWGKLPSVNSPTFVSSG